MQCKSVLRNEWYAGAAPGSIKSRYAKCFKVPASATSSDERHDVLVIGVDTAGESVLGGRGVMRSLGVNRFSTRVFWSCIGPRSLK